MEIEMVPEGRTAMSCGRCCVHGEAPPSSGTYIGGDMTKYSEKLKDPRWQKKRLEIFQRDEFACVFCGNKEGTLHVHHKLYISGKNPWDYELYQLATLCEDCHEIEYATRKTEEEALLNCFRLVGFSVMDLNEIYSEVIALSGKERIKVEEFIAHIVDFFRVKRS